MSNFEKEIFEAIKYAGVLPFGTQTLAKQHLRAKQEAWDREHEKEDN